MDTCKLLAIICFLITQIAKANCAVDIHQLKTMTEKNVSRINSYQYQDLPSGKLKVLVWNVYGGKKDHFVDDFNDLYTQYDLALFQEANLSDDLLDILKNSQFGWEHATSFKWLNTRMGVATGSLHSPTQSIGIKSVNKELGFTTRKTSLLTKFKIQGQSEELAILNVHALNFRGNKAYKQEVDQFFEKLKDHQGPMIVAGDFNTWNKDRLEYLQKRMNELSLTEVDFKESRTKAPIGDKLELDRIFYRGLDLNDSKVLVDIETSDHLPLTIEFTIR